MPLAYTRLREVLYNVTCSKSLVFHVNDHKAGTDNKFLPNTLHGARSSFTSTNPSKYKHKSV